MIQYESEMKMEEDICSVNDTACFRVYCSLISSVSEIIDNVI